jgi:hypothetical protein
MMFALLQAGADEHVVAVGHDEVDAARWKSLRRSTPRVPRILPTHGPRAFRETVGIGLNGIELVVI